MISKNQLGIIFMILSVISFSVMDIVVKLMSSHYPTGQLIFFRGFFGLIPILFIIPKERFGNLLKTEKIKLHLVRAFGGAFAMTFLYLGLKFLPIADAITISFAAPIFATIFSIIFLNEKVRLIRWLAIFFGLTGVIIVLKPGTELFTYYSFFPILFCIGFATISIAIKKLSKTEPDYLIALYFTLVLILFGLISISMGWKKIDISDIHYLIIIGLSGSIGNIFLTKSIREADISLVTPIKYLSLVFAIIAGWLIFNEIPSALTISGAMLIILSTFVIFKREAAKKIKPTIIRQL
ncbi:DMT family transporter [Pelagibacteraceae bacterium]|jgi:drug/metabolite transporter (DMT)-like permease|nr:DMT family transporter [Pelagibacteraceae bacterium]MDB3872512.1 DMT family transporter [Pelagibacteraceae bacterium]